MASTAPVTGSSPGKVRTFLIDHERLIVIVLVAIFLWWGYGKYAQIRLDHDNSVLAQAKVTTDAQVKANQQLAQQVAQDAADRKALEDRVTAQNQQLTNANVALATALSQRQKTDASLPIPALVDRWAQLVPGSNFAGAIGPGNNVAVTPSNALATVDQLERIKPLTDQLANETDMKANDDTLLASADKSIIDLNSQVAGAVKLDQDHQYQCTEQIKVVKDDARKSKRKWFTFGFITGFLTGAYVGHAL